MEKNPQDISITIEPQNNCRRFPDRLRRIFFCLFLLLSVFSGCSDKSAPPEGQERSITISGSASAYPTLRTLASAYENEHPDDNIFFLPPVHSNGGIAACADGTCDLGIITRATTSEEKQHHLLNYPLALDYLVFATHPNVGVHNLTINELLKIYSGLITNWQELGGADQNIVVLDRPVNTSSKKALLQFMKGQGFSINPNAKTLEGPSQMNEALTSIPGSIGYSSSSDLQLHNLSPLNLFQEGSELKTGAGHKKHSYPSKKYALVSRDRPKGLAKDFINFIYSQNGQQIIRSLGHVPERRQVNVALIPEINILDQETRYRGLLDYLSDKVGVPFKSFLSPSYSALMNDFVSHDFDAAFLGSFSYVLIKSITPMQILARPQIEGKTFYKGVLFAHKNSGIKSISDMRNRSLCLVDKATSAGYLFPLSYFKQQDIGPPEKFFQRIEYTGTHEEAIRGVLQGRCDVGAAKNLIFSKLLKNNPQMAKNLVILAESTEMPTNGLAVRKSLDWDIKEDLVAVLLAMHEDPAAKPVLAHLGAEKFLPTWDEDYRNVYNMLDILKIDPVKFLCTLDNFNNSYCNDSGEAPLP